MDVCKERRELTLRMVLLREGPTGQHWVLLKAPRSALRSVLPKEQQKGQLRVGKKGKPREGQTEQHWVLLKAPRSALR